MIHVGVWFFLCYYTTIIIVAISLLRQQTDTKRNPSVVLYTHIAQLMTRTTVVYIAAAYFAIMLLILFSILQRVIKRQRVHVSEKSLKLLPAIYFLTGW